LLDLGHQFLVRFGNIIEGKDAPSELEEEVGAEGYECPEGKLSGG